MLKCLICALACLVIGSLSAEVVDWEQVGSDVKELHTQARKEGDLWSAIQLESFVQKYPETKTRLSAYLGRSALVGSPLFAFPENIRNHWDLGEDVWAITARRFYALKDDGRPSQLSFPVSIHPDRSALDASWKYLALAQTSGSFRRRMLFVALMDVETGEEVWRNDQSLTGIPEGQQDHLRDGLVVAADGSAIVASLYRQHGDFGRIQVITKESSKPIRGLSKPVAIGPGASWLIAHRDRQRILISGAEETALQDVAVGPGVAVVRHDNKLSWLDPQGALMPFAGNVVLGKNPNAWSHGKWLVVGTGEGAETEPVTDLFGNVVAGSENQPYSLAFFRWSELLENAKADPVAILPGRYSRCDFRPHTLYQWTDNVISLIDLNGEEPEIQDWTEVDKPVNRVDNTHHYARVRTDGGSIILLNNMGKEVWRGDGFDDAWAHSRNNGIGRINSDDGASFTHITLSENEAERKDVPLQLAKGWWNIRSSEFHQEIVADSDVVWHRLDMQTGKIIETVVKDPLVEYPRPPRWQGEANQRGRFFRRDGRLLSKKEYSDEQEMAERLVANDALYVGRTLLVIDKDRKVLSFETRKGFEKLGDIEADIFTTDEDNKMLLLSRGRHNRVVAQLERGPKITEEVSGAPANGKKVSSAPWNFDRRNSFMPPKGSRLVWDNDRAGFSPRRLRSGGKSLIVVTSSVLLVVEPRALPLLSGGDH